MSKARNNADGTLVHLHGDTTPQLTGTLDAQTHHISNAGTVGVGTASPTTYGDGNTKLAVATETTNANDVNIRFGTNDVKGILYANDVSGDAVGLGTTTDHNLQFKTNNTEYLRITNGGRFEFQSPTNNTGALQDQRLDWRNENNAGIMASIGVHREGNFQAPAALVFRTSTNVDSASNNSDGEISEKMRISSGGIVTAPNQPAFFGYKGGGGNSTAANGAGVIDTVGTDVGNNFNTTNGRFTCPVAGRYLVTWTMMNSQSNTGTSTAKFRWNSTPYKYFHVENSHPQGQSDQVIVNAAANDYFDLDITHFHFNGGSQYKYPSMCVILIG
jgi:hypothetical protein